jgi:hypothetical protein
VKSSTSSKWTKNVLKDLYDATEVANGVGDDNDSAETSIMGTKFDKKNLITSTAAFLAQGTFSSFDICLETSHL